MRTCIAALAIVSVSVVGCAKQEAKSEAPAASAGSVVAGPSSASPAARSAVGVPRIGGALTAVGDASVELVVHRAGWVEALVTDAAGQLVTQAALTATISARGGAETIALSFVPARARFEGRAKAGVELQSGPVDLSLSQGDTKHSGRLALAAALETPELGGHVLSVGSFGAEVVLGTDASVRVRARAASGAALGADARAKVSVRTTAGADEELTLSFDAPSACFIGKAKSGVSFAPGPLSLQLSAGTTVEIGRLERLALLATASHGGQRVAVGEYGVELVLRGDSVRAFVFDATGKAITAADLDLKLGLGAGAASSFSFAWNPPSSSYEAALRGGVDLSGPVRLTLSAAGKSYVGAVAGPSLEATAKANLAATAGGAVAARVEPPRIGAKASSVLGKAANAEANAKVSLTAPKIDVSAPKVTVKKSAAAGAKTGGGAKASAGFSFGAK